MAPVSASLQHYSFCISNSLGRVRRKACCTLLFSNTLTKQPDEFPVQAAIAWKCFSLSFFMVKLSVALLCPLAERCDFNILYL
ncbi:hypothetical protein T07_14146 [Trichinella nelsoni]|uniref:Uncharacterized protein n=1 Tax=Trichinella nelsoni TaxID=6336 RepID=A0A0V0SJP5_9BILA|nr:hypothetical protein T07_14146 [Trichinella nelsoni]